MVVGVYCERGGLYTLMMFYILQRLRATTQSLIVLETDHPVTIPTTYGQMWQDHDSGSGLTQLVKSRESLACLQSCNGSPVG